MPVPATPKICHIVHVDRLPSIIEDNCLWCDAEVLKRRRPGTEIGMNSIKQRRLTTPLSSHPDLCVGDCVPFYFWPRSVMLYVIAQRNKELTYQGGQAPIIHLIADLRQTVAWAVENGQRWAFTLSNAGSFCFEDRCDLAQLGEINWDAVRATTWSGEGVDPSVKEHKQAEFLIEKLFPWELVSHIGVLSQAIYFQVKTALDATAHKPPVEIKRQWYY